MGNALTREQIIHARRGFRVCGNEDQYKTLADVGFDRDDDENKDWVTPYQKISNSLTGPVLVALHWLDVPSVEKHRSVLKEKGYLPGIPFNEVVCRALRLAALTRDGTYVTQAFHLLPAEKRSAKIPRMHIYDSFTNITRHEIEGRAVMALGTEAAWACRKARRLGDLKRFAYFEHVPHPSARGMSYDEKAEKLATALNEAMAHLGWLARS